MNLLYMGNRGRQDLLSRLVAWGPLGRVGGARRGVERNLELSENQFKKKKSRNTSNNAFNVVIM